MPELTIRFVDARSLDRALLLDFAAAVWPDLPAEKLQSRWWLTGDFAAVTAAFDEESSSIAAICVGVPSRWPVPEGEVADAISICGWYVHPDFAGSGLGRAIVLEFGKNVRVLNTLSISDAAVRSFARMGWTGPFKTKLRLLPWPRLRLGGADDAIRARTFDVRHANLSPELARALDDIDARRPAGQLRRLRDSADWRRRLQAKPDRKYRFHVMDLDGALIGYFATRWTDAEAGRRYRVARLRYVADAVFNTDDTAVLRSSFQRLARSSPATTGALLMCTSNAELATVASEGGWLDERSRLVGQGLDEKAPRFMLGGDLASFPADVVRLTFADSDVDLNI